MSGVETDHLRLHGLWEESVRYKTPVVDRRANVYAPPKSYPPLPYPPKSVLIEPTNACNHRCIFCYNRKARVEKGLMSMDLYRDVLQQTYEYGIRDVGLFLRGEPFIHPRIDTMVEMAKDLGFLWIHTVTNGALLSRPERIMWVLDAGLNGMVFSINGGDPEQYRQIHGMDDFDAVIANLIAVDQYRKELGVKFHLAVSYITIDQNAGQAAALRELVAPYVDEVMISAVGNQGGYSNDNARLRSAGCFPYTRLPCGLPFHRPHITWDGLVSACCVDFGNELVMGDLKTETFTQVWEGAGYAALRDRMVANDLPARCTACYYGQGERR